ncbi:MAG TPA: NTP transferase domain-containing protein [Xanthomonadales bacterium]|nr:NTP transferase domain-containing protein [Xanthomonadales bacterium]
MNAPVLPGDVTGAILAGGRGSRAGGIDKGLAEIDGEAAVVRIARALRAQVASVVVSANRHPDAYAALGFEAIADDEPGFAGPLAGIASVARRAATRFVLTVPVDCGDVPAALLATLAASMGDDVDACVAHDGERRQPLFALYRRECSLRATGHAGEAVWRFQDAQRCREVRFPPGTRFANRNTIAGAPC